MTYPYADLTIYTFQEVLKPGITTIDHFLKQRARLAVDMLLNLIDSREINSHVTKLVLEPNLIVRESTR